MYLTCHFHVFVEAMKSGKAVTCEPDNAATERSSRRYSEQRKSQRGYGEFLPKRQGCFASGEGGEALEVSEAIH